jgi:hypothetical protein
MGFVLFPDTDVTLKNWRVFECMPIFKVLLVGVDFVSLYRSWAVFAIVSLSLLCTVLVKHIGEVRVMNVAVLVLYSYVLQSVITK